MKPKVLVVVVLILALVSGAVYFVRRPAPATSTDARVGQPLATPATLEKAAKLKITDQGKEVDLAKGADGVWHVTNYYDLPADSAKLVSLVGDLTDTKVQRFVTSSPDRIARLEFKDTQITFSDAEGKELWSATLGKTSDTGGHFLRFGDEQKAYLANLNLWLDPEPKNWANAQLVDFKSDAIAKIEVSFPDEDNKTVTAVRAKKEDPFSSEKNPVGRKLNSASMTALLNTFSSLQFSDTTELNDPKVAAAKGHERTVKFTTFDGKTTVITLARKPEEKIIKPPVIPSAKSGPASVLPGSVKSTEAGSPPGSTAQSSSPSNALEPTAETIPAGPVFVSISYPEANSSAAGLLTKRAVTISDYPFTSLPQKSSDLFEPVGADDHVAPSPASAADSAQNPKP